jgi:hypothetical protein
MQIRRHGIRICWKEVETCALSVSLFDVRAIIAKGKLWMNDVDKSCATVVWDLADLR